MGILLRTTPLRAYGLGLLLPLLASLLSLAAWPLIQELTLLFFFVAVVLSAWYGGLGPGVLATLVATGMLAAWYFPPFALGQPNREALHWLGVFIGVAVFLSVLSATRQQAEAALRAAHEELEQRVQERTAELLQANAALQAEVHAREQAEGELRHAKEAAEAADRTKSEFLATMSHELRTPLNVILGYTEMLLEGGFGDLPAAQRDILRRIDRNSRMLFELISMVLDLNRLEAGRLPVDIKEVPVAQLMGEVRAEMQGLCEQSGLAYTWHVGESLPPLHTDPGKLKVVLKNLMSNAVKFTPEGSVTVQAWAQRGGIEFSVTDTGIGIPPEALTLIFEPFRQVNNSDTRPYSGSGLGLHIVQRLLEVLGGTITVESEVGKGSTFRVWLPTERGVAPH
jgi:signal transduction histidine kinase